MSEVVERGATRNAVLNARSASGEVIPTSLNASALCDSDGKVILPRALPRKPKPSKTQAPAAAAT